MASPPIPPAAADAEPAETSAFWFEENTTPDLKVQMRLETILFAAKSPFQRVQVVETAPWGKTLVLDGKTQSALADEYIYHESLVHPALLAHGNPKTVFIGGGGEFGTAREILKHRSVESVVMVDIDEVVCDICRKELPEWNAGAYEDPRTEVHYEDAKAFLERDERKYDVIVMDIADPIEAGPGYVLYTKEFYDFARTKLNDGGVLVTQSGPGAVFNYDECFTAINRTLRASFDVVVPYSVEIPSFGSNWGFNIAFNDSSVHDAGQDPRGKAKARQDAFRRISMKSEDVVDSDFSSKFAPDALPPRFLDGETYRRIFALAKPIRAALESEERIMTVDNPIFMY